MSLEDVFHDACETVFTVFESLIRDGEYLVTKTDGWDDTSAEPNSIPMDVIINAYSKKDVEQTSFYDLVQVTDLIVMIRGRQITTPLSTKNMMQITHKTLGVKLYSIEAWDTDPASALYVVLLRASN